MFILIILLAVLCFGAAFYLHKNTHGHLSHRRRTIIWSLKLAGAALIVLSLYILVTYIGS